MFDRLAFVFGEAMIALRRNGFMTFSAITTVAIALYLLGGLGLIYLKATDYAKTIPGKFDTRVFLKDGTDKATIKETAKVIRQIPGVSSVTWIPRTLAWEKERREHPELTAGIDNPYPDSYKVTLNDLEKSDSVDDAIRALPAVAEDGVQKLGREEQLIEQILKLLGWLSSAGALLLISAGILIFNTIRLAILSRRIEIRIMQLVGASRLTVAVPFFIEGLVQGLIGGLIAAAFVWASYSTIGLRLHQSFEDLAWAPFPASTMFLVMAVVGSIFGAFCSLLAIRVRHHA